MATEVDEEKIDIENNEDDIKEGSDRADSPVSSLSLDVLAQVASDRLQTDDSKTTVKASMNNKEHKKAPKRALQSLDRLNLQQIKSLSNKLLVSLFSEMSSDELRRQYTLTCLLEPDVCSEKVTVYGNEMKAKIEMQRHLTQHLASLVLKYKDDLESYVAETLPGRKKKFFAKKKWELKDKRKKKSGNPNSPYPATYNAKYRRGRPPMFPQTLHDYADLGYEMEKEELDETGNKDQLKSRELVEFSPLNFEDSLCSTSQSISTQSADSVHLQGQCSEKTLTTAEQNEDVEDSEATESEEETRNSADLDKEALILNLLAKSQPYADHNYTSIFGKKKGIESMHFEDSDEETEGKTSTAAAVTKGQLYSLIPDKITKDDKPPITVKISGEPGKDPTMLHVPILKLPQIHILPKPDLDTRENQPTPEEQVLDALTRLAEKMTEPKKIYPPMPSPYVEKQGRIPEEMILNPAVEEPVVNKDANPYKRGRRGYETTSGEWERKAALKCIKELRLKKKFEPSLVCKICKDKTFTATATLMYHYRSHAGIKPFVCLICNTTFTRQHSLNYHMLIHNNQSRFTCKECGRKFRHPSHFKEHMRRHTGETPYHCTDCPLRFKTRNTYKRHLRTRHDKLLTVLGIRFMTQEEIARNDSMPESDKEEGDESTESDVSQEDTKDIQTKLVPIQPKPPFDQQQQSINQLQAEEEEEKPKITITDDSPLGQIQSIESTSRKTLQNSTATTISVPAVEASANHVVVSQTLPTVTPVKIEPSLFVTQALLGGGSVSSVNSLNTGDSTGSGGVTSSGSGTDNVVSLSGISTTVTQMASATPTIQLQVPTMVAAAQQAATQPQTLNIATLPRIQLLTASGQPLQIPQLVQTTPTAVAQLTPTVGPQLVLAAPPTQTQHPTISLTPAHSQPNALAQNSGNSLVSTNGIINVPINQATFQLGGQFTAQNSIQTAVQPATGISLLTVANANTAGTGGALSGNQTNTVTLQMKTDSSQIIVGNTPIQTVAFGHVNACSSSNVGVSKMSHVSVGGGGLATIQSSGSSGGKTYGGTTTTSPDTPATNTLLKFCTQVANQVGQVVPPNL